MDPSLTQAFELPRGDQGVLLLHGFAGTPPEVRELGLFLAQAGYTAHGPLLTGHGTTPEEMAHTRWRDWAQSAQSALDRLRTRTRTVHVGGQSMGGLLALYLAARNPDVRGVFAFAAPLRFADWRVPLLPVLQHVVRFYEDRGEPDLGDPTRVARLHSHRRRPTACINSLAELGRVVRRLLPEVRCPALIMHGRRDRVSPPSNSQYIYDHIGSSAKRLAWMERSGHAISVDWESDVVNATTLQWLVEHP
jgi:carboxylesterase